jgi:Fe-S cluster assembly protein SufD
MTHWQQAFASRAATTESAAFAPQREAAMAAFTAAGFPTPALEDWHYTSLAGIAQTPFVLGADFNATSVADLAPYTLNAEWPTIVLLNGSYSPALSSVEALSAGVRVLDLGRAWREMPERLAATIGSIASSEHAMTALNTGLMRDGVVVLLDRNAVCETPIHVLHVADAGAAKVAAFPRTLIVAEQHAQATVVESFIGLADVQYFTNHVAEVTLAAGANVTLLKLQREGKHATHVSTTEVHQARDSHFQHFSLAMGASLSRTNVYTALNGENCGSTLNGLYLGDGTQHMDHQTRIEHAQPNCFSRELYKGVLDGEAHAVFNGKVYVHAIAQKTDGKQSNHTLLLSDGAHIDTKPQLEIFADDVKCTHGATVGQLDKTGLFYMKSRGVSAEQARKLMTYAFAADVLETIEHETIRVALEQLTLERFTA